MTELEKKAKSIICNDYKWKGCNNPNCPTLYETIQAIKIGYEQGQKDFDTDITKLLNSYGVTFIDTNSIGGLIALHQIILDLEKENGELKWEQKQILEDNEYWQTQFEKADKERAELQKAVEQLKAQYKKQRNRRIDELQKAIAEKNSVIEKLKNQIKQLEYEKDIMKCCYNCDLHNTEKTPKACHICWNYSEWKLKK